MLLDCCGKDSLGPYRAVCLIYEDVDGILVLANHSNLVGSETDAAARMINMRAGRENALPEGEANTEQSANIVTQEIENRDKTLEVRDLDITDEEREIEGEDIAIPQAVTISHPSHLIQLSIVLYLLSNILISILWVEKFHLTFHSHSHSAGRRFQQQET